MQQQVIKDKKAAERDDIRALHRNLKVELNIYQDENLRLKTKVQSITLELQKYEREVETIMR